MNYDDDLQKCIDALKPLTDALGLSEENVKSMIIEFASNCGLNKDFINDYY